MGGVQQQPAKRALDTSLYVILFIRVEHLLASQVTMEVLVA